MTALPNYPTGRIFEGWSRRPLHVSHEGGVTVRRLWIWAAMGSGLGRMMNYASFALMSLVGLVTARRSSWVIVEYPTLFGALPAVVLGRLRRQRVAILVADLWIDTIAEIGVMREGLLIRVLRGIESWMFRRVDVVTAVTEGVRGALVAKGVDPARIAWLPNGVDTDTFRPGAANEQVRRELGLADDEAMILYAGTHGYVHGLEVVLDAAKLLGDTPIRFVLIGDGSEKPALLRRAIELELSNVVFHDPVPPEDVAQMLRASVAGLATVREGDVYRTIRSAKMLPTMATGRPVIYSGADEGARLVAETGAGIVTPAGDASALAIAVRHILESPDEAACFGEAGRSWAEANATWSRLVREWVDRIDEIAAGQSTESKGRR